MATCALCGAGFTASGRRQFCSGACRQAAYRQRSARPAPEPAPAAPSGTVYECPSCQTRYLGIRRCPDCNQFCSRIGPGGLCPHCEEPVARSDLQP